MLVLFTDTDCDITPALAKQFGYKTLISMPYVIDEKEIYPYEDWEEFDAKGYYDILRSGTLPTTCAISPEKYRSYIEPEFAAGNDILYVHFSAAMSGTFNALHVVLQELKEKYPERQMYLLDTKAITVFSRPIVERIGKKYLEGASIEELLAYGKETVDHQAAYFFADDLRFFAKSGRVSGLSAVMGSLIGIKPIISIGDDGVMKSIGKETGKLNAMKKLLSYIDELGDNPEKYGFYIAHTDAMPLVEKFVAKLVEKYGPDVEIHINPVNPTAGAHCGPNCMGVSFHSIHR